MNNQQLTVLTANTAAHLSAVFDLLGRAGIDVRAHCLVDNGDGNCKLRLIVSDPDAAAEVLKANRLTAIVNEVVIVETDDRPGGLSRVLKLLDGGNVRIDYSYTAASERAGIAVMVFRFSDNRKARKVLERNGLTPGPG
jgi:hypothetical protein